MLRSHEGKQWQNDCDFVQTHSSPFQWLLRWRLPDLWPLTVSHKVKSALSLQLNGVQLEITRSLFLIIVNVMNLLLFIADLCHLQTQKFTLNRNSYMDRTSQIWNRNSEILPQIVTSHFVTSVIALQSKVLAAATCNRPVIAKTFGAITGQPPIFLDTKRMWSYFYSGVTWTQEATACSVHSLFVRPKTICPKLKQPV